MKKIMYVTALLVLFGSAATAQKTYSLSGTVADSLSRQKISNASVWINPSGADSLLQWNTITDGNGHFTVNDLYYGEYIVHIVAGGFEATVKQMVLGRDDEIQVGLLKTHSMQTTDAGHNSPEAGKLIKK